MRAAIFDLDGLLAGSEISEAVVSEKIEDYYRRVRPEIPGVAPSDWVAAVMRAAETEAPA